ncbi:MAG TPA: Uma2 family endonuclease, partial [Acidimicrobiales bacterium]
VHRRGAQPVARLGSTGRLARWSAGDVALVVEVADSSLAADLETKARVYGRSGYPVYWVVHRGGVEVLTEPYEGGYRRRRTVAAGGRVDVPYLPGQAIEVDLILDAET